MIFERVYGIDLGNSSVKIYSGTPGEIYTEKNIIASQGREIIAVGDEAYAMYGRQPVGIKVRSPMSSGTISELELQEIVLYTMFDRIGKSRGIGSVIYFTTPPDMSSIEKRAYYYVVNGHWLRQNRVYLVESPIAEALALGIDPDKTSGAMIVNIGSQSTSFSIIADGRILMSRRLASGGKQMTEAVCAQVRREHHLQIGNVTGRMLKTELGSLEDEAGGMRKVIGIDSVSGLPREENISGETVKEGIRECVSMLASELKSFLTRIPPQTAMNITKEGIYLTGGSVHLPCIHQFLADSTGYSFNLPGVYEKASVTGLEKIIQSRELRKWAAPINERKF